MAQKTYNKLVRDRIPEIIGASGKECQWETLEEEAYLRLLDEKLREELEEYLADHALEEIADLLEVIRAVVVARGHTMDEVEQIRRDKAEKRGGFEKRIVLKTVNEPKGD